MAYLNHFTIDRTENAQRNGWDRPLRVAKNHKE
jgi:hypothetical protein